MAMLCCESGEQEIQQWELQTVKLLTLFIKSSLFVTPLTEDTRMQKVQATYTKPEHSFTWLKYRICFRFYSLDGTTFEDLLLA